MTAPTAERRICQTCHTEFAFTEAERDFRQANNLPVPGECPGCRGRKRQARNADLVSLYEQSGSREFQESTASAPRAASRRPGRGNGRAVGGPRQMYNTVCADCGAETQVPFVPRCDRPVYCRDCYNARNGR